MTDYISLQKQARSLISGCKYLFANLSNLSALINDNLDDINWAGFYLVKDEKLVLGPFQGKPACIEIPIGKGVCGEALKKDTTLVVPNVHLFKGHIACDSESNSEIVIPIHKDGVSVGVLDIDSKEFDRFSLLDQEGLEGLVKVIEEELSNEL